MLYIKSSKLTESTPHRSPVVDEAKLQRPAKCGDRSVTSPHQPKKGMTLVDVVIISHNATGYYQYQYHSYCNATGLSS